jgi:LmbE family N-acetylglucosaminyl deacetylase
MLSLNFNALRRILCLGAHSDDIEIGCGGTLIKLLERQPDLEVHWIVFSATDARSAEAQASAEKLLPSAANRKIVLHQFRDTCFPFEGLAIKESFLELQRTATPDLIFTHRRADMHQDHRLIAELTWNAFRDHTILEYEIPKYDGDFGAPNCYVPLDQKTAQRKIDHLLRYFPSQQSKRWFTADTFQAVLRLRGIECNSSSGLAEGFDCRKLVFD